ncbi:MAG: hypothetical protein ACP5XB_04960, partial [Isosphaeraceae bacterium]
GLLMALSPNIVTYSIEIRAYPLFLLESAVIFWLFLRRLERPRDTRQEAMLLFGIVLTAILAVYTHFFGLLLSGGVFLALLVLNRHQPARLRPILAGMIVIAVASLGVLPFVRASIIVSQHPGGLAQAPASPEHGRDDDRSQHPGGLAQAPSEGRYVMVARLAYRLVAHPSMSAGPITVGAVAVGAVLAVLAAALPKRSAQSSTYGLMIALGSGYLVAALAQLVLRGFSAALPSYNLWMVPGLFLVMASGLAARSRMARGCALVGIALIVAGDLFGVFRLATAGDYFAHTSYGPIARLIDRLGPERVAVLYDDPCPDIWQIYSPMWYTYGRQVSQYCFVPSPAPASVRVVSYPTKETERDPRELDFDYLIVVQTRKEWAVDLMRQLKKGPEPLGDGPLTRALLASPAWQRKEENVFPSYVACDVDLFQNTRRKAVLPAAR